MNKSNRTTQWNDSPPSREEVESALDAISPSLKKEDWERIGRAIASEYGADGEDMFVRYSSGHDRYNANGVKSWYRHFVRTCDRVNIDSLFHFANETGWRWHKNEPISESEKIRREEQRNLRQAKLKAERVKAQREQEKRFKALLNTYHSLPVESGDGLYLQRKLPEIFYPHPALKRGPDYTIFPLSDKNGDITGFQQIFDNDFKKTTGRVSGSFFMLGALASAKKIYLCEGLTTAFTVHVATGCPVAVCLSATNIQPCSEALKSIYPGSTIIGAADNDQFTGSHAGKINCEKAGIDYVMPNFAEYERQYCYRAPKDKPTDFNDLFHLSSIPAVLAQLVPPPPLTPNQCDSQYLGDLTLNEGATIIRSPKGSGKTTAFLRMLRGLPKGTRVLLVSNRVLLVEAIARAIGADYYQDVIVGGDNSALRNSQCLSICVNSLPRLIGSEWDVVIVDESEQVFGDVFGKTMKGLRANALGILKSFLKNSTYQIMTDSDISDITLNVCKELELKGVLIDNQYQARDKSTINFHKKSSKLSGFFIDRIETDNLYYCSNSLTKVKNMKANTNKDLNIQVLTSEEDKAKMREFVNNLDTEAPKLNALLCSPTAGSGLDITNHNFVATYAEFNSRTTTVQQAHQQLCRVRGIEEYHVCLPEDTHDYPTDPKEIRRMVLSGSVDYTEDVTNTEDIVGPDYQHGGLKAYDEGLLDLYCDVTANRNKSRNNFKEEFIKQAIREGYTINYVDDDPEERGDARQKQASEQIKQDTLAEIESAEPLQEEAFESADYDLKGSVRYQKASIARLLQIEGGELNAVTYEDINKGFMGKVKKLAVIATPMEGVKKMDAYEKQNVEFVDFRHPIIRKKLFTKILSLVGIDEQLQYDGKKWHNFVLKDFSLFVQRNRTHLMLLGFDVPKNPYRHPAKFLNNLLRSVGIETFSNTTFNNKKKSRVHQVRKESLEVIRGYAISVRDSGCFGGLPLTKTVQEIDGTWTSYIFKEHNPSKFHGQNYLQASGGMVCRAFGEHQSATEIEGPKVSQKISSSRPFLEQSQG